MNVDTTGDDGDAKILAAHGARVARACSLLHCARLTVGYSAFEDSTDAVVVVAPPEAPPGTARFLRSWLSVLDLTEPAMPYVSENNEGTSGELHIDFTRREVRGDLYSCEYSERLDTPADHASESEYWNAPKEKRRYAAPPEGMPRPTHTSDDDYKLDRYLDLNSPALGPNAVVLTLDKDYPERRYAAHYVADAASVFATAHQGAAADYLEDPEARSGPSLPRLAAVLRQTRELDAATFERLGCSARGYGAKQADLTDRAALLYPGREAFALVEWMSEHYTDTPEVVTEENRYAHYRATGGTRFVVVLGGRLAGAAFLRFFLFEPAAPPDPSDVVGLFDELWRHDLWTPQFDPAPLQTPRTARKTVKKFPKKSRGKRK